MPRTRIGIGHGAFVHTPGGGGGGGTTEHLFSVARFGGVDDPGGPDALVAGGFPGLLPGTLMPTALDLVTIINPNGQEVACYVDALSSVNADGSVRVPEIQFTAPGVAIDQVQPGWKLRIGTPFTVARLARRTVTTHTTSNATNYKNEGYPAAIMVPTASDMCASGLFGDLTPVGQYGPIPVNDSQFGAAWNIADIDDTLNARLVYHWSNYNGGTGRGVQYDMGWIFMKQFARTANPLYAKAGCSIWTRKREFQFGTYGNIYYTHCFGPKGHYWITADPRTHEHVRLTLFNQVLKPNIQASGLFTHLNNTCSAHSEGRPAGFVGMWMLLALPRFFNILNTPSDPYVSLRAYYAKVKASPAWGYQGGGCGGSTVYDGSSFGCPAPLSQYLWNTDYSADAGSFPMVGSIMNGVIFQFLMDYEDSFEHDPWILAQVEGFLAEWWNHRRTQRVTDPSIIKVQNTVYAVIPFSAGGGSTTGSTSCSFATTGFFPPMYAWAYRKTGKVALRDKADILARFIRNTSHSGCPDTSPNRTAFYNAGHEFDEVMQRVVEYIADRQA